MLSIVVLSGKFMQKQAKFAHHMNDREAGQSGSSFQPTRFIVRFDGALFAIRNHLGPKCSMPKSITVRRTLFLGARNPQCIQMKNMVIATSLLPNETPLRRDLGRPHF